MKTLFISAGHSTTDPGAVGNGLREADVAVEMRNIISFYLTQAGVVHTLDGKRLENVPLRNAIVQARKHQIAIEIHCNAGPPSARGVETLSGPKDMKLGRELCAAIATVLSTKNRGAKPENSGQHARLGFVQAGGLILELFFISNVDDVKEYTTKKWLLGRAIAGVLAAAAK